jgi:hypothetical protein
MKSVYKILGILCFVFAALLLLLSLIMVIGGESGIGAFFAIIGAFFVFLGSYTRNYSQKRKPKNAHIQNPAPIMEKANTDIIKKSQSAEKEDATPLPVVNEEAVPQLEAAKSKFPECEYYSFKVAGISFYEKDIIDSLAVENDVYDMTKRELIDMCLIDEPVYKYQVSVSDIQLEDEPNNPHDSNAIKVLADGVHIGYVPAKNTSKIRKLLKKSPTIICNIYGGPSKTIHEDYSDSGKEVYTIEKTNHNFGSEIILKYEKAKK